MSNSPTKTIEANESYLGYVLRERIGAGGYGEVWSAEAPGGMLKAVKFIYGFHDDNRAQRELKALDRIKEVHIDPFSPDKAPPRSVQVKDFYRVQMPSIPINYWTTPN